jgi:transcriptional regulator with XRE-family HTH domain
MEEPAVEPDATGTDTPEPVAPEPAPLPPPAPIDAGVPEPSALEDEPDPALPLEPAPVAETTTVAAPIVHPAPTEVHHAQPTAHMSTASGPPSTPASSSTEEDCETDAADATAASTGDPGPLMTPAIPPLSPWSARMVWAPREPAADAATEPSGPLSAIEHTAVTGAGLALVTQRVSAVSVAVDFARASGGWAGPLMFNVWLRRQLRERRMSQRQLAMLAGINHSAISRIVNGHASPTLETATKLVHALRMEWTGDQIATYFDLLPESTLLPTQRVESALRGDGTLGDVEVRAIMQHYLALRAHRKRAGTAHGDADRGEQQLARAPARPGRIRPVAPPAPHAPRRERPRKSTASGSIRRSE